MSRATTLYVLDVSPRISAEEAKNVTNSARYAIESKLSFTPTDEVGLVFVGTAETHNALHEQCGAQYEHITIAQELLPSASAGVKVLRALLAPPVRQSGADLFMALVTAVHMLRERIDKRRKKAGDVHRVMLATSGMEPLDLPDDKALDEVASMCKEYDITVTVLTSGIDVAAQACTPALAEKLSTLQTLTVLRERLGERIRFAELADALKQLAQPRVAAQPASRTKFKGLLELGGGLKLRVAVYSKVIEKKLKSPKTFSLAARDYDYEQNAASGAADGAVALADADPVDGEDMPATDSVAARWAVSKETGYATAAAQLVNVPPEGVIRAYKFGQDYVPVDNIQAAHFKFLSGAKCLQLVGFVADGAVPRTHLLGGVDVLTADKDDEKGAEALAALVQAVAEEGSAMLLRFIPRANAPPRAALCVPCAEDVGGGKTAFYFIMHNLPFSDEVRSAVWPAADASSLPTAAQLAAAAALVDSMMLASAPSEAGPSGDESAEPVAEPLCPETTPNPYIQHVNRVIMQRALAPGTPLADLDPALAAMLDWDPSLKARSQAAGAEFEARCPWALVKAGDSGLKRTRAFAIVDAADGAVAPSKRAALDGAELEAPSGPILLGGTQARSSIGRIDPVADLQRMLNDRVSDLTQPALEQMSAITLELAADVRDDGARALALACVEALRDACLDRLEPTRYNNTLQAVREATGQNEADGAKLWSSICARPELTLISSAELDESEITPQEATLYLAQASAAATQPFQPPPPASSALAGDVNVLDDLE